MIVDKPLLPPSPSSSKAYDTVAKTPVIRVSDSDEPPAYNTLEPSEPSSHSLPSNSSTTDLGSYPHSRNPSISQGLTAPYANSELMNASASNLHITPVFTPKKRGWFSSKSRTTKEAREWVLNLIGELARDAHYDSEAARSVLGSCSEACTMNNLSFSTVLQEKSVENHTPFYWSIINRPTDSRRSPDLLAALLSFGSPLTDATRADIRHACLMTNDQPLFQHLRCHPNFMVPPTSHEMIFAGHLPKDDITIEELPSAEPAFVARFEIGSFIRRMNFEKEVVLEFIAHRRAWKLAFSAPSSGKKDKEPAWLLSLSLLEHSPSTYIDSRFIIDDASPSPVVSVSSLASSKPQPSVTIRLKSTSMLVPSKKEITVSLEDSLTGASLRSPSSSYISADETLKARFEARLKKPESECIIC